MVNIKEIDTREFRNALGQFPTGVTIVTTLSGSGEKVGMTASSFNSVSLTPPLVLWSIDKGSYSYETFANTDHFAIHVLGASQDDLSSQFARRGIDKFEGIDTREGVVGSPILPEFAACFQCKTSARHDAGDHLILVGEVLDFESHNKEPLLFHNGRYAEIA